MYIVAACPRSSRPCPSASACAIAFSGGLDTSVAVAWMREKGAVPCTYTADLGPSDEPEESTPSRTAPASTAPRSPASSTAAPRWSRRGCRLSACGAFHIRSGGRARFNTTPLGRAGPAPSSCGPCGRRRRAWGDSSAFKGNDIDASTARQPQLQHLKAQNDAEFVHELGAGAGQAPGSPSAACPTGPSGGRRTRPRPSSTSESLEDGWSPSWASGSELRRGGRTRGRDDLRRRGGAGGGQRAQPGPGRPGRRGQPDQQPGGRDQDQIENRIIEAKSRGVPRRPAWRGSTSPTSGCSTPCAQQGRRRQLAPGGATAALRGP